MLIDTIIKETEMTDCINYTSKTAFNVFLFITLRVITHYSAITFVIYIFWPYNIQVGFM